MESGVANRVSVALFTGGGDRPYVFGLATALLSRCATLEVVGSDETDCREFHDKPGVTFLNLRGNQRPDASLITKIFRVARYYGRLIRYAVTAKPTIFHVLWNNKIEVFDRTLLMLYYRLLGKRIVLTAHNVNARRRDGRDTWLNRLTLRIQYGLADHIFVHTNKMKLELLKDYGIGGAQVTVIPFGINNAVPNTSLTPEEARQRLGIGQRDKVILFFGNILPYKGLEYLVSAFQQSQAHHDKLRLIIAGRVGRSGRYWEAIHKTIQQEISEERVLLRNEFIPDDETEIYFKAADVLVLPYKYIYQSGVLFLGQRFGLPVIAADVGPLKDEIIEGKTGFIFRSEDSIDLARTIDRYFASDLYTDLNRRRFEIRHITTQSHSWDVVGQITMDTYAEFIEPAIAERYCA